MSVALQVVSSIAKGGASLWYRRMPLSRNRTPSHQDLSELHEGAFCADGSTENVQYVIIARAAASSTSACFAAHFLCVVLDAVQEWEERRSNDGSIATVSKAARTSSGAAAHDELEISTIDNLCRCSSSCYLLPFPCEHCQPVLQHAPCLGTAAGECSRVMCCFTQLCSVSMCDC